MSSAFEKGLEKKGFVYIGKDDSRGYSFYVKYCNRYGWRSPEFRPPIEYIPSVQFLVLKVNEKNPEIFDVALHLLSSPGPSLDNENSETFCSGKLDKYGKPVVGKSKELKERLDKL
jgi:hypothetical protein